MYKRIVLKLSGEAFEGEGNEDISMEKLSRLAEEVIELQKAGHEVVIVLGAGNIWRYRDNKDACIQRTMSDYMGMLGTIMNSVALQSAIENLGAESRVCSAIHVPQLAEPYLKRRAERHLEKGRIVICAGGTGNPYFTTDSAAALRSLELDCNVIIKATKVDGVYDDDPEKNPNAKKYDTVSFDEVIEKNLKIMDQTAFSMCRDGKMPIIVLNMGKKGNILKAANGERVGTIVK